MLLPFAALAQTDWPTKPISMVVPYPPGGVNDAVARVYAEKLSTELGKPVIVDNRAGAATTVASNFVAKAAPDGYTIYAGGTSLVINPTLTGQVQYDPHKSFELVSLMSFTPFILHVNTDFPAKNMAELIAVVKANPGKFNIASSGIGATNHLAAELLKAQAGLNLVHVPYKGGAQAGQDVAGGQAQMMFSASLEAKPLLASGRTRAIAISSPAALARLSRHSDRRRVDGAEGFRGGVLAGHGGAGRHAPADRRQAAEGDRQGRRRSRRDRALQAAGRGDQELDPGRVQGLLRQGREALGRRSSRSRASRRSEILSPASAPKEARKRGRAPWAYGLSQARALFERLSVIDA